jgi:hypothetical protein
LKYHPRLQRKDALTSHPMWGCMSPVIAKKTIISLILITFCKQKT